MNTYVQSQVDRWVDLWWSNPMEFDGVGLETAPTFAKELSNAHARVRTTTRCSVMVAPPLTKPRGIRRDCRGTAIDTSNSRGTGLSIIYVVTSTRGEGVEILRRQKRRGRLTPPSKIVQMGFALDLTVLPRHTCDATPRLCGINTESAREPVGGTSFVSIFSVFYITLG